MRKDPDSSLDYSFDWSLWLSGDTIATSTWIVPAGLIKGADFHDNTTATVWISGGTNGQRYTLTNRITTAAGRINDHSVNITVRDL